MYGLGAARLAVCGVARVLLRTRHGTAGGRAVGAVAAEAAVASHGRGGRSWLPRPAVAAWPVWRHSGPPFASSRAHFGRPEWAVSRDSVAARTARAGRGAPSHGAPQGFWRLATRRLGASVPRPTLRTAVGEQDSPLGLGEDNVEAGGAMLRLAEMTRMAQRK